MGLPMACRQAVMQVAAVAVGAYLHTRREWIVGGTATLMMSRVAYRRNMQAESGHHFLARTVRLTTGGAAAAVPLRIEILQLQAAVAASRRHTFHAVACQAVVEEWAAVVHHLRTITRKAGDCT